MSVNCCKYKESGALVQRYRPHRQLFFCVLCPNSVEYDVGYIFPGFYLSVQSAGVFLHCLFHIFHSDPIREFFFRMHMDSPYEGIVFPVAM